MMPEFPDFLFNAGFISDSYRIELRHLYERLVNEFLQGKEARPTIVSNME